MKSILLTGLTLALVCDADKLLQQSQYAGGLEGSSGGQDFATQARFGFGNNNGNQGGSQSYGGGDDALQSLSETIPGVPGEDYPIYSEVPETSFFCDGQVDGGYYGDPEAECQVFHICVGDGTGGLSKYSFLCPNGTLFNQQYFVCDWWFNVDCSTTEDFYSLNDEIAAEREANSPGGGNAQYNNGGNQGGNRRGAGGRRGSGGYQGSASAAGASYSSPNVQAGNSYDAPAHPGSSSQSQYGGQDDFSSLGGYARNPRGVDLSLLFQPSTDPMMEWNSLHMENMPEDKWEK